VGVALLEPAAQERALAAEDRWLPSPRPKGAPTACRFSIDGSRYYSPANDPDARYPSVTTILGKTAGAKAQQALETWALKNPGAREEAAERGTLIHAACEDYIRGLPVQVPERYEPYWRGLSEHLDKFDYFIWSERPLQPEWSFCIGDDGISRIWSHRYKYAGCPDLVGYRNGVAWLTDFKTSVGAYSRYYPREDNRSRFGGWKKFAKTSLQLGAYAMALEETLGIEIEIAQILVSVADGSTQSFLLRGDELHEAKYKWLQRVAQYEALVADEATAEAEARLVG
jgi:hypothetical protein